jgi:hypothetical protein
VAFWAWAEGHFTDDAMKQLRSVPPANKEALGGFVVVRNTIPDYCTREFATALRLWSDWKRFGLPYPGGWAEQPEPIMAVIRLFEAEYTEWESKKNDSRRAETRNHRRSR